MRILRKIDEIKRVDNPVVTIGTFDGIHLGHQQILHHLVEKKKRYGGNSFLITFEPHPQLILRTKSPPIHILTTLDEKLATLEQFDIDYVVVLEFTSELSRMTGEEFIQQILVEKIGAIDVVIGYDHAFGYRRSGNIDTLRQFAAKFDFRVNVIEPFFLDGQVIKSTLIRDLIRKGKVDAAQKFLGRPYQLTGKVITGEGRGRRLNFPTANLAMKNDNKLIPGNGIYAVKVKISNHTYQGAASIGIRPTFDEKNRTIEAYIFDFNENIYHQIITLEFVQKLREEEKFSSIKELIEQMEVDVKEARKVLNHPEK